jgi:hypothetical protein
VPGCPDDLLGLDLRPPMVKTLLLEPQLLATASGGRPRPDLHLVTGVPA